MTHYYDLSKLSGCVGIIADPGDRVVCTGTQIHTEPGEYQQLELTRKLAEENDFHFWFDEGPKLAIYTVPKTELGGYDSKGGFFAGCMDFTLREKEPMYYIDAQRRCWLITTDSGEFLTMGASWREKLVPTDAIEVFDSYEQARTRYPIHRPENHDELLQMLKGEWEA